MIRQLVRKLNTKRVLWILGIVAGIFLTAFLVWIQQKGISVINPAEAGPVSKITGLACDNEALRPVAIMMPSDPEARPLSGISSADIVFEMPVTPNGITRYMAVFQCDEPKEIGSIRSAREDFITLAAGMKALYGHWGGEHDALNKLNSHIIDNVDALKYEGTYYYRKASIPRPHNGFTTVANIFEAADALKYSKENTFEGYPHQKVQPTKNLANYVASVHIDYIYPLTVDWKYNEASNSYSRFRGSTPELDRNGQTQVSASVIAVMHTTASSPRGQYITIKTSGEGTADIYQNGQVVHGTWKKDPTRLDSKLFFYDIEGKEIKFAPGKIWVEIVTN